MTRRDQVTAINRKRLGQRARGDLPGEAPPVLAPAALTFLAAIADDRVPVAVRLFLSVRRDLEGKGFAVPELRAAVETEAIVFFGVMFACSLSSIIANSAVSRLAPQSCGTLSRI